MTGGASLDWQKDELGKLKNNDWQDRKVIGRKATTNTLSRRFLITKLI